MKNKSEKTFFIKYQYYETYFKQQIVANQELEKSTI